MAYYLPIDAFTLTWYILQSWCYLHLGLCLSFASALIHLLLSLSRLLISGLLKPW